jgi:ABC-type antimicrobial peptide transport system permease subunit
MYRGVRFALRCLRRTPIFTVVAIAVLAIGIGANATIFSLVSALFLKPMPGADPASLVRVSSNQYSTVPHDTYLALRDRNATLDQLAAFNMQSFGVRVGGEVEHVFGTIVSGEYFSTLGIPAFVGRLLEARDDRPGAPPAAVLSHGLWTRAFAAAPDIIGRTIAINDVSFAVVGVAPAGFTGVMAPLAGELWVPLATDALLRPDRATVLAGPTGDRATPPSTCRRRGRGRADRGGGHCGRQQVCDGGGAKPAVPVSAAGAGVHPARNAAGAHARIDGIGGRHDQAAVRAIDPGLPIVNAASLEAATSISLLPARLAGAVVTGLGWLALVLVGLGIYGVLSFLVRSRTREIGIRVALGATPAAVTWMVVRQALSWTSAGAAIGLAGALLITRFLTTFLYGVRPADPVTFAAVIGLLGLVAGIAALVPAVAASRLDPQRALRAD